MEDNEAMIQLRGIKKYYSLPRGGKRLILDIEDFSLPSTGLFAITGPSGSGKSTLLNLLSFIDSFDEGELYFGGRNVASMSEGEKLSLRHAQIGYLRQQGELLPYLTALENVLLPLKLGSSYSSKEEEIEAAKTWLERFGILELAKQYPSSLSGGEHSRVALARALINQPSVLFCDEPTGSLEESESRTILELLRNIAKSSLVFIVSHDEDLMQEYCDAVFHLKNGKIQEPAKANESNIKENSAQKRHLFSSFGIALKRFKRTLGKKTLAALIGACGILGVSISVAISDGIGRVSVQGTASIKQLMPLSLHLIHADSDYMPLLDFEGKLLPTEEKVYGDERTLVSSYHVNVFDQSFLDAIKRDFSPQDYTFHYGYLSHFIVPSGETYRLSDAGDTAGGGILQMVGSYLGNAPFILQSPLPYASLPKDHDVLYGRYPQNEDEAFLLIGQNNHIEQPVLNALGFDNNEVSFADIVGKSMKCVPSSSIYQKRAISKEVHGRFLKSNEQLQDMDANSFSVLSSLLSAVNAYMAGDEEGLEKEKARFESYFGDEETRELFAYSLLRNEDRLQEIYGNDAIGKQVKVTGILRLKGDRVGVLQNPGLYYSSALGDYMRELDADSPLGEELKSHLVYAPNATSLPFPSVYSHSDQVKAYEVTDVAEYASHLYEYYLSRLSFGADHLPTSITFDSSSTEKVARAKEILASYNEGRDPSQKYVYEDLGLNVASLIDTYSEVIVYASNGMEWIIIVANTLLLLFFFLLDVRGRIKEIGIYQTLGASKGKVLSFFLAEGFLLGLYMSVLGIATSYLVLAVFDHFVVSSVTSFALTHFATLSMMRALSIIGIFIAISLLATLVSSFVITLSNPRKSLQNSD